MSLTNGTIWAISASATTGNVNGSGYNIANAGMLTDLAATVATGASPVVTSATYAFVAGDVGQYVYVKAGTNWIVGWYPIASVVGGGATLDASVGAVVLSIGAQGIVTRNTSTGCASVASPTGGTFGVDYSQTDTAIINGVADFNAVGASTTLTSATAGFTPVMVGNIFHQTTTGTGAFGVVGWYEIATYVNATTVTLDRTPNSGTASVNTTGYVGGAGRLNGLEDTYKTMLPASSIVWIKNGTYTISGNAATTSANSTASLPSFFIGYNALRGDTCNGTNRPIIVAAASTFTPCQFIVHRNISWTSTSTTGIGSGSGGIFINCKFLNSSSSTTRVASSAALSIGGEFISQNGIGLSANGTINVYGCYIHDSANGMSGSAAGSIVVGNIFEGNITSAISLSSTAAGFTIYNNTIYGREAQIGIGINLSGANSPSNKVLNNLLHGCTTGISVATGFAYTNLGQINNFYNNTTDVTNWTKDATDTAVNPQFVNASQITGTAANTSGSVLTDSGANFAAVTDNVDFLHVVSGTGVTVGCYLITSHTSTTLTVNNALGTSSSNNDVYWISNGHNFQVNSAFVGTGFPNFTNATGSLNTSYPTIGAMVPQVSATGASMLVHPGMAGGMRG